MTRAAPRQHPTWVSAGGFQRQLAGRLHFLGWLRAHPVLHLPVEAAVPVARGLQGRWRLAATFYLSSLVGTACTDQPWRPPE